MKDFQRSDWKESSRSRKGPEPRSGHLLPRPHQGPAFCETGDWGGRNGQKPGRDMRASVLVFLSYFIFSFLPGLRASLVFLISMHLFILFFGCGPRTFSSCREWGCSWLQYTGFSSQCLLCGAQALRCAGFSKRSVWAQELWLAGSRGLAQYLWHTGLVAAKHMGSSRIIQGWNPCILHCKADS